MEASEDLTAPTATAAEALVVEQQPGLESEATGDEAQLSAAQRLISKIIAAQDNPNPRHLHALASIIEKQEARYRQDFGSSNTARSSHCIGRLSNLIKENDEFYELVSSKFLSKSRYTISIHAAAARILLSCPSGMYPLVFDDDVLVSLKSWVMEDSLGSAHRFNWKHDLEKNKSTDFEMLKTYATGLLAISLAEGVQVIEDILTSGLSAKLMRYLRIRILGESSSSLKDIAFHSEAKHPSVPASIRCREDNRGRPRQVLDGLRIVDEGLSGDQNSERDQEKNISIRLAHEEECYRDGGESLRSELVPSSTDGVCIHDMDIEDDDVDDAGWHNRDILDGKLRFVERQITRSAHEDADENVRDDSFRRRINRGWPRSRGKGRTPEGTLESDKLLFSPSSGLRLDETTRSSRDRNSCRTEDVQIHFDDKKNLIRNDADFSSIDEDDGDRFKECIVGSQDVSEFVNKAIKAAEAEARAANAPAAAIKAAGDAAAELVKSSAFEVWINTNEAEAAVQAASKAAFTVVDAAIATKATRSLDTSDDLLELKEAKFDAEEEFEEFFIFDGETLAQLREKYCILCLEILGEYVEALGPVLHEKGVDVCLALLQRCSTDGVAAETLTFLPEVLKLICALAAHRKFSALFVDQGGMQKLLSVDRASHTFVGLSSCLFTIGSLQGVMERICALSSDTVYQIVELALELLESSHELARKNAAIFFSGAFVFRAILDPFDAQDGINKMLCLLQKCSEVLSSQEKAIAYHACVSLRQYFRSHLLLFVDSIRPNKSSRNVARGTSSGRAFYKPLDICNEVMDVVLRHIQRDRKLGSAFVRARWPVMDKFLSSNGHITILELFQALTLERYLHDLAPFALGVLHIVTLVPYGRKLVVNATLSNNSLGMAVILDAANGAGYVDPEVIHPALSILVNLVCPPPSISNKPSVCSQPLASTNIVNASALENRERHSEHNLVERNASLPTLNEFQESNLLERGTGTAPCNLQITVPSLSSGVVGDRRICLGPGAGCAGLAAQLEQGYHQARVAVRANNGIKILLHLLHPRMITPPPALDCIRALVCRVLLGLARDETIAHILTKLQVGKKLSELIRDLGSQASANEFYRWQTELIQVAVELIAIVTNSERECTIAATDATAPTLRRIERAAIASATPITYHSRELLLLIHEHLQVSGLTTTAAALQKEAGFTPLPSLTAMPPFLHQISFQETSSVQIYWPSGRTPCGFLLDGSKSAVRDENASLKPDLPLSFLGKKPLAFSSNLSLGKNQPMLNSSSNNGLTGSSKNPSAAHNELKISQSGTTSNTDSDNAAKTLIHFPMKRKLFEHKDTNFASPAAKRFAVGDLPSPSSPFQTPSAGRRSYLAIEGTNLSPIGNLTPRYPSIWINASNNPVDNSDDTHLVITSSTPAPYHPQSGLPGELLPGNTERMTLDSVVLQYLKHQHRQCSAPISTLPPLSLLHPHVCPQPSHMLNAPANVTARISTREVGKQHYGITCHRDHQFVHSRFKPCRTCRDDVGLLTSIAFLGNSHSIATGSHSGELIVFDTNDGNKMENFCSHQTPIWTVQSLFSGETQLILSSGTSDVKLWDASSISNGPLQSFDGCKFARFSHAGTTFAALGADASSPGLLLYDIQTCNSEIRLPVTFSGSSGIVRGQSLIHFSPLDTMLLWDGVLWDRRSATPLYQFDQFTDYGGGGFHPSGNEVILNSEVWDLRKFKLLRSVPSLDQTVISFNSGGDVIYAILRRNLEDITPAVNTRRIKHPLFQAFRTIDAMNYSDIATFPVDRCILDLAIDPTESYVGLVAMDDHDELFSSARLYEIGRRRPTEDDSDPDDGGDSDEEEEEDEDDYEADTDPILGSESEGESDSDDESNDEDNIEDIDSADETNLNINAIGDLFGGQMMVGSDFVEDEDSGLESYSSDAEEDSESNGFRL